MNLFWPWLAAIKGVCKMLEKIVNRLVSVKSIVTIIVTAVFAYLSIRGNIPDNFMTIYTAIIAFYFGTQYSKPTSSD